jgi:hypothetical protein
VLTLQVRKRQARRFEVQPQKQRGAKGERKNPVADPCQLDLGGLQPFDQQDLDTCCDEVHEDG